MERVACKCWVEEAPHCGTQHPLSHRKLQLSEIFPFCIHFLKSPSLILGNRHFLYVYVHAEKFCDFCKNTPTFCEQFCTCCKQFRRHEITFVLQLSMTIFISLLLCAHLKRKVKVVPVHTIKIKGTCSTVLLLQLRSRYRCPVRFTPVVRACDTHWRKRWVCLVVGLDVLKKE